MDRPIQSREDGYHSNLEEAIAMIWDTSANWATPNTMDSLPPRSFDAMKRQARNGQRKNRKRPANLREQIEPEMQRAYDEARKEANWPTPTTQETPHEEMELTETGRRKTKDGKDSHSLNLQDVSANWPTPLASDENYRVPTENWKGTNDLPSVVSNWPTPGANEDRVDNYTIETSQRHLEEGRQVHLAQVVKMNWPTPKAGNPGSRKPGTGGKVLNEEAKNWPTPNVSDNKDPNLKDNHDLEKGYLRGVATTWPTPTAAEADKIGNRPNYGQKGLSNHPALVGYPEREKMGKSRAEDGNSTNPDKWPTPAQRDYKGGSIKTVRYKNGKPVRISNTTGTQYGPTLDTASVLSHSTLQDQETETDGHTCSPSCRRLNPLFAEHLMGLPLGWTCVSEPLATESFQRWQLGLSAYLARS